MNDAEYDGRTLSVSVARPRAEGERAPRRDNNRGGYGNRDRNRY
jgi:hypothetical protein